MKKIIISTLICCFIMFSLVGCTKNKNNFSIGKVSNIKILEKGVSLSIKDKTLTNKGVTLILKNDSDYEIQYGASEEIEIKKNGKWHKINVDTISILPIFILKPQEQEEIVVEWEYEYGKLTPGNYRIIKSIGIEKKDKSYETFYVSAEFIIK